MRSRPRPGRESLETYDRAEARPRPKGVLLPYAWGRGENIRLHIASKYHSNESNTRIMHGFAVHQRSCGIGLGSASFNDRGPEEKWISLMRTGNRNQQGISDLAKEGIPEKIRPRIWSWLLNLDDAKAQEPTAFEDSLKKSLDEKIKYVIDTDILRTFPGDGRFRKGHKIHERLREALYAFAAYDSIFQYTQGMNYVAGLLAMHMDTAEEVFWMLNRLCFHPLLRLERLFRTGFPLLREVEYVFRHLLKRHLHTVHVEFQEISRTLKLPPSGFVGYIVPKLFFPLFTFLPLPVATRIWDVMLTAGFLFLYKVGFLVLDRVSRLKTPHKFSGSGHQKWTQHIGKLILLDPIFANPDSVILAANRVPIKEKEVKGLVDAYRREDQNTKYRKKTWGFTVNNSEMIRVESFPSIRKFARALGTMKPSSPHRGLPSTSSSHPPIPTAIADPRNPTIVKPSKKKSIQSGFQTSNNKFQNGASSSSRLSPSTPNSSHHPVSALPRYPPIPRPKSYASLDNLNARMRNGKRNGKRNSKGNGNPGLAFQTLNSRLDMQRIYEDGPFGANDEDLDELEILEVLNALHFGPLLPSQPPGTVDIFAYPKVDEKEADVFSGPQRSISRSSRSRGNLMGKSASRPRESKKASSEKNHKSDSYRDGNVR